MFDTAFAPWEILPLTTVKLVKGVTHGGAIEAEDYRWRTDRADVFRVTAAAVGAAAGGRLRAR
jgi:hypothetical protein